MSTMSATMTYRLSRLNNTRIFTRFFSSRVPKRVRYPFLEEVQKDSWKFLKQDMIDHFQSQDTSQIDTTVHLNARSWPRFASKESILAHNDRLPCIITKYGPDRGVVLNKSDIMPYAFDEKDGHLSYLFTGRLFKIRIREKGLTVIDRTKSLSQGGGNSKTNSDGKNFLSNGIDVTELCYVSDYTCHNVEKQLYFLKFERHVPYRYMTTVQIPVSLVGLYGCPGQLKGGHIELAMPTIECEVIGDRFPAPFLVDCSQLRIDGRYGGGSGSNSGGAYGAITLRDLEHLLEPYKGTVRFSRRYYMDQEVLKQQESKVTLYGESLTVNTTSMNKNLQANSGNIYSKTSCDGETFNRFNKIAAMQQNQGIGDPKHLALPGSDMYGCGGIDGAFLQTEVASEMLDQHEVVMCYDLKQHPETSVGLDYEDPNFLRRGKKIHLTYSGFWPKQATRA